MGLRTWLRDRLLLGSIQEWPSIPYEKVEFLSRDGVLLRGWWLPAFGSSKCMIVAHGGLKHRADPAIRTIQLAEDLVERGFNVLMFDFRGHGDSEGKWKTIGLEEAQDLRAAFNWTINQKSIGPGDIAILGFFMGAGAALLAAAQDKRISVIISDSCWANFSDIMRIRWSWRSFLRSISNLLLQILLGKMKAIDPIEIVGSVSARIFFIHGRKDATVPCGDSVRLYEASRNPGNQLQVVDDVLHVEAYRTHPKDYIDQVVSFLEKS